MNAKKRKPSNLSNILAEDVMTEAVVVIKKDMTIGQVAHLMLRARVSGYPVVDDKEQVVGIVTLTDLFVLIARIAHEGKTSLNEGIAQAKDRPISQVMSANVISITPETPIDEVIKIVVRWNIHTFPVMKDDKLVGILGRHDVLNAAFSYI